MVGNTCNGANLRSRNITACFIINVDYSANQDLLNVSDILGKKLLLAPRFLFGNVNGVRNPMEDALIAIGGGADVNKTLADASKTIKSNLGA